MSVVAGNPVSRQRFLRRCLLKFALPLSFITALILERSDLLPVAGSAVMPLAGAFGVQLLGQLAIVLWQRFAPVDGRIVITIDFNGGSSQSRVFVVRS